jgi:hypothetical protein
VIWNFVPDRPHASSDRSRRQLAEINQSHKQFKKELLEFAIEMGSPMLSARDCQQKPRDVIKCQDNLQSMLKRALDDTLGGSRDMGEILTVVNEPAKDAMKCAQLGDIPNAELYVVVTEELKLEIDDTWRKFVNIRDDLHSTYVNH